MGVSGWLLRRAAVRPLVVATPYGTRARLLAEAALARRGLRVAGSPAQANLLVVCGRPAGALAEAVETAWAAVPGPRARADLPGDPAPGQVAALLDRATSHLADDHAHHAAPTHQTAPPPADAHDTHGTAPHGQHGEHGGHGAQGGHDPHGAHGGGGHAHHMGSPGGLAMAERGPDRDGLALDRLHVPLGPVLPDWPSGLVMETTLQGDLIQEARLRVAGPAGGDRFWDAPWLAAAAGRPVTRGDAEARRAAAHLDSLGRLLAVAGWPAAAAEARLLRDHLLARPGDHPPSGTDDHAFGRTDDHSLSGADDRVPGCMGGWGLVGRYGRFAGRVRRSWVLRWMLRGLGTVDGAALGPAGPAACDGDVLARMDAWLTAAGTALEALGDRSPLRDDEGPRGPVGERGRLPEVLPSLVTGCELAEARLVVASFDPDAGRV